MAVWFMSSSLESKGITSSSGFRVSSEKDFFEKERSVFFFILQDKIWIGNEIDKMNDEKELYPNTPSFPVE